MLADLPEDIKYYIKTCYQICLRL